jgi:hypothetical protein
VKDEKVLRFANTSAMVRVEIKEKIPNSSRLKWKKTTTTKTVRSKKNWRSKTKQKN